jgi:UDP-GlcNAc3NAcA epimerase
MGSDAFQERIVHTGQHYDANMSDVFFDELEIPRPHVNLGVGGGLHGQNTGRMLERIEAVMVAERPDCVVVYGDTDSTLAGALAAVKLHIPVAHIEAGLRSFNKKMPEEINRCLTDHVSDLLFVPSAAAVDTLAAEGIEGAHVFNVGDVMYDAALMYGEMAETKSTVLQKLSLEPQDYILATVHRQENTDDVERLRNIFAGLGAASRKVILPLHPRTRQALSLHGIPLSENISIIEPVGYLDMIMLEKNAALIATDSGGVQKEAYFYSVPCVTLRDETEWNELVHLGWNRLASPSMENLKAVFAETITEGQTGSYPYGNGKAASAIVRELSKAV